MKNMTVQERIEDIISITGLSEDIIRRVLNGERESIIKSLRRGERATLIGRCVLVPELRTRLQVGNTFKKTIKISASVANSIESELSDLSAFETVNEKENIPEGVVLMQLPSLT